MQMSLIVLLKDSLHADIQGGIDYLQIPEATPAPATAIPGTPILESYCPLH